MAEEAKQITDLYRFINDNGVILPNTSEVKQGVIDDMKAALGNNLDANSASPTGRLVEFLALAFKSVLGVNAQNANQMNIHTATGRYLDGHGSLYDLPRRGASRSRVLAKFTGVANMTVFAGLICSDEDTGAQFVLADDTTLNGEGIGYGYMDSSEEGSVPCAAGKLTVIENYVEGLVSVVNEAAAETGTDLETDDEYRARLLLSLNGGVDFVASISNRINRVGGVTSCVVYENGDSLDKVINGVVVKGHSIFVCVQGGMPEAIARAIYRSKPGGCGYTEFSYNIDDETSGIVRETVPDQAGNVQYEVVFHRPLVYSPTITVTLSRNLYTGTDLRGDVANAVTDYCNRLGVGRGVTSIEIGRAIIAAIPSVNLMDVSINGTSAFAPRGNCIVNVAAESVQVVYSKWEGGGIVQ